MKKILSLILSVFMLLPAAVVYPTSVGASENTAYVSTDGVITGFDGTVYTSISSALSALSAGDATIYLEGVDTLPVTPDLSKHAGKTLKIVGYNNSANGNVVQFKNATKSFIPTGGANIVFDNITVKHADGSTTEDWIFPSDGSITFGENCLYEHGYRADKNLNLKMHIGSYYAKNGGTINFYSPDVQYSETGSIAGYLGGTTSSFTTEGDVVYNFNAGIFDGVYGGMRNSTTGFATLNGDVYYNFNGADLSSNATFAMGNLKNGVLNGNILFTFNGGKINRTLYMGSSGNITDSYTAFGNMAAIINADSIKSDGNSFTLKIVDGKLPTNRGKLFVIINHAEDLASNSNAQITVSATAIDYYLSVKGGKLSPVFAKSASGTVGRFLGFNSVPDTEGLVPAIGGTALTKNSSGYYTVTSSASLQEITFIEEKNQEEQPVEGAVYVSTDGVISGFDGTVYTSISSALSALPAGDATIYLEGVDTLPVTPDLSKHAGKTLKIVGYNNSANGNVVQFKNATKSFVPTGGANIVFDNITVKHADGSTTEDWIFPSDGSITFGKNCLYEHGYRADKKLDLKMYIGSYYAKNGGTINFDSPDVQYAETGSIAGYLSGTTSSFTTEGDVVYNFNAGTFDNIYGGMRNGTSGFATLNGDVYYNFNGATLSSGKTLATGNISNGIINGNIFFTFNGGNVNRTLKLGSTSGVNNEYCAFGNTVVVINRDKIAIDGAPFTLAVSDGQLPDKNHGKIFVIINHIEKDGGNITVNSASLDYYVQANGGSVTPVFEKTQNGKVGEFLGFDIVSDTEGLVPAIFGKMLSKNENGYYHIDPSVSLQTVEFAKEEDLISNVTLKSGISGQADISARYSNGKPYTIPECPFTPASGKVFACWTYDGKDFFPGDVIEITQSMTFDAKYTDKDSPYVFYVNTESGADSADGLSAASAFKTLSAAVTAINSAGVSEGRIHLVGISDYENIPKHTKKITLIGGAITADATVVLSGDTVFDGVKLARNTIYTAGNTVHFAENSNEVINVKLVLSAPDKASANNGAILDGGHFAHVILTENTNTENTYLSVSPTCKTIKKLTLGGTQGTAKNLAFSLNSPAVSVWSTGEKAASGDILFYLATEDKEIKFALSKDDLDADKFIFVKNGTENEIPLSRDSAFAAPDGKHIYAMGQAHIFYPVGGKMTITEAGEYDIRTSLGDGADYYAYPTVSEGKYFDKWENAGNGHLKAIFTDQEKLLSYYVSEKGSDENSGTSAKAPFASLTAAVNALDGKDGRVVIMDTAYWSESSSVCNVPVHAGTITFEGLSEDKVDSQIIDYSRSVSANGTTASLKLQGNSIFKNISFRAHHYKSMYTGDHDLRLEGKIGYIKGTSGNPAYTLFAGAYAAKAQDTSIYLGADLTIGTLNIGHNTASVINGDARIIIDGTNVQKMVLCGTGATLNNVDIIYVKGSVGSFTTTTSTAAKISGDLTLVKSNGAALSIDNAANLAPANTYEYTCDTGIFLVPTGNSKTLFKVLSDVTAKSVNKSTGKVYYSSKGGYIGLPVGSYNITKSDADYYTNDGDTITILKETSLDFDEYLYRNEHDGIFAGWCYEGKTTGPASGETLAAGTVLKANYVNYDPAGKEFGIIGLQIRIPDENAPQGLRFIVNKDNTFDEKFNITEYGAVIFPKVYLGSAQLVLGGKYEYKGNTFYSRHIRARNIFDTTDNGLLYTLCLIGIDPENYNTFYTTRAYAICKDANGHEFTVYSDPVSSSLVNITRNNVPHNDKDKEVFENIMKEWKDTYFSGGTTPAANSHYPVAYTVNETGVSVRELTVDSGKNDGKTVQISMITDAHLNSNNEGHTEALDKALKCASFADQIVLCGDNVESISSDANVELFKTHVLDLYPDVIALLGNHEYFYPGSGSMDDIKKKVDAIWPHNPDYYSRLVGDKVLVVSADNARCIEYGNWVYYFTEEKVDLLKADIEYARKNGYTILFFCHVGLNSLDKSLRANGEIYELITSNADVIKGCFSGHGHVDNSATLQGSYIDENGNKVSATIPYHWLRGCAEDEYKGHVLYINVK